MLVLHGEQYLELQGCPPVSGTLVSTPKVLDIQDKGKAAVVVIEVTSIDQDTGNVVAINEVTTFLRGAGGFGKTPLVRSSRATCLSAQKQLCHAVTHACNLPSWLLEIW